MPPSISSHIPNLVRGAFPSLLPSNTLSKLHPDLWRRVVAMSQVPQTPMSISHLFETGKKSTAKSQLVNTAFLHNELSLRLSRRIIELGTLPQTLANSDGITRLRDSYVQSFQEMINFRALPSKFLSYEPGDTSTPDLLTALPFDSYLAETPRGIMEKHCNDFTELLKAQKLKHRADVLHFSLGVNSVKEKIKMDAPILQLFMDSFNRGRIGIRLLQCQHIALSTQVANGKKVGIIDSNCDVLAVIESAACLAQDAALRYYGPKLLQTPDFVIKGQPMDSVSFSYMPTILQNILFELFKNSLRATIEFQGLERKFYNDIVVVLSPGKEDLTIKISDYGGGISKRNLTKLESYTFSTAPTPILDESILDKGQYSMPLAGLGFGLPISKLYAEYLGGKLEIVSMEGFGTDAYLYLNRLSTVVEQLHDEIVISNTV